MRTSGQGIASTALRICRGALVAVALAAASSTVHSNGEPLAQSLFVVEARGADGSARQGSAVAIGTDTLVTNCHVTRRAASIIVLRGGQAWRASVRAGNGDLDLCVLSVPSAVTRAVQLREAAGIGVGEPVFAAGFPAGKGLTVHSGVVTALHRHEDASVIQVSAPFDFGASGGGLFDRHGNLVGVLTFKMVGPEGRYFAVPTEWITRVVNEEVSGRAARGNDAPAFWERAPRALPTFLAQLAQGGEARRGAGTSGISAQPGGR